MKFLAAFLLVFGFVGIIIGTLFGAASLIANAGLLKISGIVLLISIISIIMGIMLAVLEDMKSED